MAPADNPCRKARLRRRLCTLERPEAPLRSIEGRGEGLACPRQTFTGVSRESACRWQRSRQTRRRVRSLSRWLKFGSGLLKTSNRAESSNQANTNHRFLQRRLVSSRPRPFPRVPYDGVRSSFAQSNVRTPPQIRDIALLISFPCRKNANRVMPVPNA